MKCPACGRQLEEMTAGDVTMDVCAGGCGGIWTDNHELEKVDETHESAGESFLDVPRSPSVRVDHDRRRECPRCEGQHMVRRFFSVKRDTEVDECLACGGFWLDPGELGRIRSQFATEADRRQAARDYLEEVTGPLLRKQLEESRSDLDRTRQLVGWFRFLSPRAWLPDESGDSPAT